MERITQRSIASAGTSDASLGEYLFGSTIVIVLVLSGWGVLLADLGQFRPALIGLGLCIVLACLFFAKRHLHWPKPSRSDLLPLLLVGASALLFFRPHEFILGGADAGVYVNTGMNLARTGALQIDDPALALIPTSARGEFLRRAQPASQVDWLRMPGYYVADVSTGKVVSQFFSVQIVWIAIGSWIGSISGALLATPLFAAAGVVALYYVVYTLLAVRVLAFGAAILLMINPTQVWFARYPTAESLTQFLFLAGFYFFTRFVMTPSYGLAFLSGSTLAAIFLARIDAFPILLPLGVYLVIAIVRSPRRNVDFVFWLTFVALTGAALAHAWFFSRPYVLETASGVFSIGAAALPQIAVGGLALLAVFLVLFVFLTRDRSFRLVESGDGTKLVDKIPSASNLLVAIRLLAWQKRFAVALAFGLVLFAAYAYFVRPLVEPGRTFVYGPSNTVLRTYDGENLVRIGWYLSPLGVFLAVAGAALLVARQLSRRTLFVLSASLLFTAMYVWNIANNPHHVYAMRRYVPVVMPALSLFMAYALHFSWCKWGCVAAGKIAVAGAVVIVVGYMFIARSLLYTVIEYDGAVEQLSRLATIMPAGSVAIFTHTGWGEVFGTPLTYIYGRDTFALQHPLPDAESLRAALEAWGSHGREVYWIIDTETSPAPPSDYVPLSAGEVSVDVPTLEQPYEYPPAQVLRLRANLTIYHLMPSKEYWDASLARPFEIGAEELGVFGDGFYPIETSSDGGHFRWTSDRTSLSTAYTFLAIGRNLTLRLSGWRPAGAPPAYLRVFHGDVLLGEWPIPPDAVNRDYTLAVDPGTNAARLQFEVTPQWSPRMSGIADDRVLGVALAAIIVSP
jgi:hypothetical protein